LAATAAVDLALLAIPAAIGVAILRYRLYDIDRLINRTLVYGLLTALLAGVYTGAVLVLGQLFGGWEGSGELGGGRRHPGRGRPVPAGPAAHPTGGGSPLQPPEVQHGQEFAAQHLALPGPDAQTRQRSSGPW
jgi:hypothetical protein